MADQPDHFEVSGSTGRESNPDVLDQRLLRNNHSWSSYSATNIDFRSLVEESVNPRNDMLRYREILQVDSQGARDTFSQIPSGTTLFQIPHTIRCDRTFARGSQDAYYIDDMDQYLSETGPLRVEDIPLLQRSLHENSMNSFNRRAEYFKEHLERRRLSHCIPHIAYERKHLSNATACSTFPVVGQFVKDVIQPAAMPLPCQPVVFYYHDEIRAAQLHKRYGYDLSMREQRLLFCYEHEYYVLFIDFWWKEAVYGGRQWVLDISSISYLSDSCGHLPVVGGKPAQVILEHMRSAARRSTSFHNWMRFVDDCMEESVFIWATNGRDATVPGEFDPYEASGKRLWCSLANRRITSQRNKAAAFKRGKSLLDKVVSVPDLERIPGLVPIIVKNQWHHRGNMKLSHLLDNLVNLHNCTNGILQSFAKQMPMLPASRSEQIAYPELTYDSPSEPHHDAERSRARPDSNTGSLTPYDTRYVSSSFDDRVHHSPRRDRVSSAERDRQGHVDRLRSNDRIPSRQERYESPLNDYRNRNFVSMDNGRRYHRTVDRVNDVEVDVYTDGEQTPLNRNTPTPGNNVQESTGGDELQSGDIIGRGCDFGRSEEQRTPRNRAPHSVRLALLSSNGPPLMYGDNTAEANMASAKNGSSRQSQAIRNSSSFNNAPTGNVPWYSAAEKEVRNRN